MTFDHSHDLVWRQSKSDTTEHATLDRTVTALLTRLGINLADFLDMPLFDILHLHATRTPDALAVVGPDTKLNWTTLVSHVHGLGAAIAARVPPGHSVAVLLPDGPEALVGILACAAAARMAHILNAGHPPARNAMILAHTGAAAILTHKIPAGLELPARITVIPPDANQKDEALPPAMPQNAPAFVIYTSGSTGRPKGIVLSQGVTIYRAMTNFITDTPDLPNRMMSLFALSSISGFHSSFSALVCGGCAILPAGTSPIPMMLAETPTTLVGLPAFLRTLMISPDAPLALASLRLMRAGGEAVLGSDIADWYRHLPASCRIQTGYGQTEAAVLMWLAPPSTAASELAVAMPRSSWAWISSSRSVAPRSRRNSSRLVKGSRMPRVSAKRKRRAPAFSAASITFWMKSGSARDESSPPTATVRPRSRARPTIAGTWASTQARSRPSLRAIC